MEEEDLFVRLDCSAGLETVDSTRQGEEGRQAKPHQSRKGEDLEYVGTASVNPTLN